MCHPMWVFKLNSDALNKQLMLLTTKPSLHSQPQSVVLFYVARDTGQLGAISSLLYHVGPEDLTQVIGLGG